MRMEGGGREADEEIDSQAGPATRDHTRGGQLSPSVPAWAPAAQGLRARCLWAQPWALGAWILPA